MDEIERAIPTPQVEIIVQGRARRQVFRDGPPLTSGGENIHEAVHNLAHDYCAFVATALAWRDQWFDQFPFVVGEVAGIAQMAAVIPGAIFIRPHRRPLRIRPHPLNHKRLIGFNFAPDRHLSRSGVRDAPSPFVDIELHQAFVSHFQQEGLASFFIHDIGAFHDLVQFERLLAERAQDIFSIIQHD